MSLRTTFTFWDWNNNNNNNFKLVSIVKYVLSFVCLWIVEINLELRKIILDN